MIEYSTPRILANPPEVETSLSREQLWQALVWKGEFPTLFIAPAKECTILERMADGFLRAVVFVDDPEPIQERVFLEPMNRVTFLRLNGPVLGRILNDLATDDSGALTLQFSFTFSLVGVAHGSAEERAYAEKFTATYIDAVNSTLDAAREFVRTGVDPTAEEARARSAGAGAN